MRYKTTPWWLPGLLLVLFGVTIVIFPELLALMVASAFILTGTSWLMMGYAARKQRQQTAQQVFYYEPWRPF